MSSKKSVGKTSKALIYARQSSGKEELSESIEMQICKCHELARSMKLEVVGVYHDANSSGRLYPTGADEIAGLDESFAHWWKSQSSEKLYREGLGELLDNLAKVKYVIVDDLTRLARPVNGSFLQSYIKQKFNNAKVVIVAVKTGKIDFTNYVDCLVSDVQSHVVDNQLSIQTQKSKDAMIAIKNDGYYPTIPKMFGIEYIGGKNREIRVIPECAEAITFIYDEILKLRSYNSILVDVNKKYRHLFEKACYNSTFRHIAEQPFYCGYMYNSHNELIEAKQMAGKEIISYSTWHEVQVIMGTKRAVFARERFRDLPYSGKLICGGCGARMVCGYDNGKIFYYCAAGSNVLQNQECRHSRINVTMVREHKDYSGLKEMLAPLLLLAQFKLKEEENLKESQKVQLNKKRIELANMENRFEIVAAAMMESNMTQEECKKKIDKMYTRISGLKEKIAEIERFENEKQERQRIIGECHVTARQIIENKLSDELYKKLLWKTVENVTCFYDYILIKTVFGEVKVNRYMIHQFRNLPRYTLELIKGDESKPFSCKYDLTYIYGNNEKKELIVDFDAMAIYAKK